MADHNLELVGWQQRWLDPEEGPSGWAFCDEAAAKVYKLKPGYEVRPVYALAEPVDPVQKSGEFRVMVCGVDCHPGDQHCNGYCTGKTDDPPEATAEQQAEPVQEPFALPCPTPKACREHCCHGACLPAPQQAEPVRDFRLTECVFVGPPPAPHEDWHHAISAMLREKHISGLRISTATVDDWNGDKKQQRKPLTEEEIWVLAANCLNSVAGQLQFARAIEAAHGIKEKA